MIVSPEVIVEAAGPLGDAPSRPIKAFYNLCGYDPSEESPILLSWIGDFFLSGGLPKMATCSESKQFTVCIVNRHSRILSRIADKHTYFHDFTNVIFPNYEDLETTVSDLKESLLALIALKGWEKVIFKVEDIDRIQESDKIRTLLALAEQFSDSRIQFIIEYDSQKLRALDPAFGHDFLERFIPDSFQLSNISLKEIMQVELKGNGEDDFITYKEIDDYFNQGKASLNFLLQNFDVRVDLMDRDIYPPSVRAAQNFLKELYSELIGKREYYAEDKIKKQAITALLMMKYFDYGIYKELNEKESPSETLGISIEGDYYTLQRLSQIAQEYSGKIVGSAKGANAHMPSAQLQKKKNEFICKLKSTLTGLQPFNPDAQDKNYYVFVNVSICKGDKELERNDLTRLLYSIMLGYESLPAKYEEAKEWLREYHTGQLEPTERTNNNYAEQTDIVSRWLSYEYDNSQIDKIIWNDLASNESEYTAEEVFAHAMLCDVLSNHDPDMQDKAFDKLLNDMFYDHLYKNACTILIFGIHYYESMCKSFRLIKAKESDWIKLLDFIGRRSKTEDNRLNNSKLRALNYCIDTTSKRTFIRCLRLFLQWDYGGNLIKSNDYKKYISSCLQHMAAFCMITYSAAYGVLDAGADDEFFKAVLEDALEQYKSEEENREKKYKEAGVTEPINDIGTIIAFLDKNLEIIQCDHEHVEKKGRWVTEDQKTTEEYNFSDADDINRTYAKKYVKYSVIDRWIENLESNKDNRDNGNDGK